MASTSELQDVRAEIKELKEKEKILNAQIEAADATARPALQQELNLQLSRLAELEKQKTLLLQESVGGTGASAGREAGPMNKFRNLLLKAGHQHLVGRVVHAAWRHFSGRIITLQTEEQAEEVYNDAQKYIKTITRLELVASNIDVDGQLFADVASRSFFYRAFRDTGPQIEVLVLKIPRSPSAHPDFTDAAEHELRMYKKLKGPSAEPPHLVPLEEVVFPRGASVTRVDSTTPVSKGLLLPWYAATLADFSFLSEVRLLHLGRQMKEALAHMHAHGLCHCDIKPSNIFYDSCSGNWYLGDYGATIEVGKGLIESTSEYCKGFGMSVDRGSNSLDNWLLAVSLLEKLPGGKLASSRHEARHMVERITSQPLQELISGLLQA